MAGAIDILRNAVCQTDLRGGGHQLLDFDTTNLVFGSFGAQGANKIYAGPASGADAIPTFRLVGAAEVGAQPHDGGLDLLSGTSATTAGIGLLELPNPAVACYPFNNGADAGAWSTVTPTQLRTNIAAQPLHANLTTLAGLTFTTTAFLTPTLPATASYTKLNTNGTVSLFTAAALAVDIGASIRPFDDTGPLLKGSLDSTKQFRIEVDTLVPHLVTVTMTAPAYDFTPASLVGSEDLLNKTINGLTLAVGTAPDAITEPTYDDTPSQPFLFNLIALASAAHLTLRCNGPADLVVPETGTIATVEGTIPLSYLSIKTDLDDGGGASNTKVPSQLAVKTYVDAALTETSVGGSGKSDDLVVDSEYSKKLDPERAFSQWMQVVNVSQGIAPYTVKLGLEGSKAVEGALFRIRIELPKHINPTIEINSGDPDTGPNLDTIVGTDQEGDPTIYVFEAFWNGVIWKKYQGHYVI